MSGSGTKISAALDAGTLLSTDMVPLARAGNTSAFHATMAEINSYVAATITTGVSSFNTRTGPVTLTTADITGAFGAPIASPVFTGIPQAPTATAGTSTAQLATTQFVTSAITGSTAGVASWNTRTGAVTLALSDVTGVGGAPLASPALSGTPTAPTVTPATDSTTKIATTAFVQSAMGAAGAGVSSFNTRAGAVTLLQSDITAVGALNDTGRNRLHNVGFTINQRGYVSGTALAAAAYGLDRWKAGASGCTLTFTQSPPFTTITITAGSLQQVVEAMGVEGGAYTLSWTGTAQGRVNAGTYAASPLTVTGLATGTAITVEFNAGTLGRVQLELGSVATPLDKGGSPRRQLAECQRFFYAGLRIYDCRYAAVAAEAMSATYPLPVQMRAAPTITITTQNSSNMTSPNVQALNTYAAYTTGSATAAGAVVQDMTFTASADL